MTNKKRMGSDPLESVIKDSRKKESKVSRKHESLKSGKQKSMEPEKHKKIRDLVNQGKLTGYHIRKDGTILQKTMIYLPLDLVDRLNREKENSIPKKSLSNLIEEKLRS